MKFKSKIIVINICILAIFFTLVCTYVFDKLARHKADIARLWQYHSAVEKRQQEDIQILFNRLNKVEAKQEQVVLPEIEKLEWLSTHRY